MDEELSTRGLIPALDRVQVQEGPQEMEQGMGTHEEGGLVDMEEPEEEEARQASASAEDDDEEDEVSTQELQDGLARLRSLSPEGLSRPSVREEQEGNEVHQVGGRQDLAASPVQE